MSQQHTTQASSQGMLGRVFKLREHGTTARTEVIAGLTTFLTMIYIASVSPQILGAASVDTNAVFVTTCLIAAFGSIIMGLFTNLPVALVPAMGLNAFFASVVVQAIGLPWQVGMDTIFWGTIDLLLLTTLRVRYRVIANIPIGSYVGIISDTGLFISMMELKNAGVVVASPETSVSVGNLTSHNVLLGILGFFITVILTSHNIHAAVLASIMVATLLGWMLGGVCYNGIVSVPSNVMTVVGHVDLIESFNLELAGVILPSMLVSLFDFFGTLIGVTDKVGLADEKSKSLCMKQALYIDSISSVAGSSIGTLSVTAYIGPPFGVSVGDRTGLTAVVVGPLFPLVIFLSPLAGMVPGYATAGALIYVDVLVTSSLVRVNWRDLAGSVPAFITAVMMSFSFSTTEGVVLGFISYCVVKISTGRLRDLSPCVIIVALLLVLKVVFIDAH